MNLRFSYISNSEYGDIKKFLTKLLMLSVLIFVVDKALAFWATQAVLWDTQRGFGSLALLYRGAIDHKIVLFGSSLTGVNIDAEAIEQKTGMTCYSINVGNASIDMCELFLEELLLTNKKPEIVFMEANYAQLDMCSTIEFRRGVLAPFSNASALTARRLNPSPEDRLAFWFFRCKNFPSGEGIGGLSRSMFRYAQHVISGSDYDDLPAVTAEYGNRGRPANGAFLRAPLATEMVREKLWANRGRNAHADTQRQEAYRRIVELTKSEKIQLVLYGPPLFGKVNDNFAQEVDSFFSQLAEQNEHVHYWTFQEDSDLLADPNLWTDTVHLNWNGAEILTQKIIEKLVTLRD